MAASIAAALGVQEKKDGYIEGGSYLVDALPEEITANNAENVKAQLEAIDEAKADLTDKELDLPASLTSIGQIAFANCSNLTELTFTGATAPSLGSVFHIPAPFQRLKR